LKKGLAAASLLTLLAARSASGQAAAPSVSKEDEAAARATAAAFAERLLETHDFAAVVREFYAEDFMARYLAGESSPTARGDAKEFMLAGVPSLTFERTLAGRGSVEDWKRLYVSSYDLLNFVYLSLFSNRSLKDLGDPDTLDDRTILGVFPPEAVKVLDRNPAAANLLQKKVGEVVVKTPEELRALAATLEEAARLTRPRFAETLAKGKHLDANLKLMGEALGQDEVKAADAEAEDLGYAKGTRLFRVWAPNGYVLLLVKRGDAMKVAWANLPSD
jgi:hypothetical protein